ncbi:MAG: hypothetical protein K9M02_13405 [Thiohalocapsa sp.]|nr:hypothetical protein [Thiohalocapsa sp.]
MSGRYAAHSSYQDSGLDWLGRIPQTWKLRRLGTYFRERRTKVSDAEYSALSVTMQGIVPQLDTAAKTNDGDSRKLVRAGDFVINSRSDRKGSSGVSPFDGSVSLISIVLEPLGIQSRFVHHLLRSNAFQEEFYRFGKGIVADLWSTNYAAMKNIVIPVMSWQEQTQIAKFLDYETSRIDALIEKQQQLIALLKEKRQAVISHAVTRGLNPDAPMRDSGVEWLGDVPAHWEVKRLKHLFTEPLRNGVSPQAAETGGSPTFSIAAVRDGVVNVRSHVKYADISGHTAHPYRVQQGDVMMMRGNGSRDLVGSVGIVDAQPPDGCIYPDILIRLRFSKEIDAQLAVLFLNSTISRPQVVMGAKTAAGIWKVSGATVAEFAITVPPQGEQARILDYLNAELQKADDLVALVESQGTLLQERRTALISAAVTGKIDVRGWRPPDFAAEAEVA